MYEPLDHESHDDMHQDSDGAGNSLSSVEEDGDSYYNHAGSSFVAQHNSYFPVELDVKSSINGYPSMPGYHIHNGTINLNGHVPSHGIQQIPQTPVVWPADSVAQSWNLAYLNHSISHPNHELVKIDHMSYPNEIGSTNAGLCHSAPNSQLPLVPSAGHAIGQSNLPISKIGPPTKRKKIAETLQDHSSTSSTNSFASSLTASTDSHHHLHQSPRLISPTGSHSTNQFQSHTCPSDHQREKRKSAAVAASIIQADMSSKDQKEDPSLDNFPSSRKRKRGEQQKAKHNVAEKMRRIEMSEAMDRIKACLTQTDTEHNKRPDTKVAILLDTADRMETIYKENERLKAQVQQLTNQVTALERELELYRGESDDSTSFVSSPNSSGRSPRARFNYAAPSTALFAVVFYIALAPTQNLLTSFWSSPLASIATGHTSRDLASYGSEALYYHYLQLLIYSFTAVLEWAFLHIAAVIAITLFLLFLWHLSFAYTSPIIQDISMLDSHLEVVTEIHAARIHGTKIAWKKALKLAANIQLPLPSGINIFAILWESIRFISLNLYFGIALERAIYFLRGVSPDLLSRNAELEVSLSQSLIELCPDPDWPIFLLGIRSLNWCLLAPNIKQNCKPIPPLYKLKLWTFVQWRFKANLSLPFTLLSSYCARNLSGFSDSEAATQANVQPRPPLGQLSSNTSTPAIISPSTYTINNDNYTNTVTSLSNTKHSAQHSNDNASPSKALESANGESVEGFDSLSSDEGELTDNEAGSAQNGRNNTASKHRGMDPKFIETTYRSVWLHHVFTHEKAAGRMELAEAALAELIEIRMKSLASCSRVTLDSVPSAQVLPFSMWGIWRCILERVSVLILQGELTEAIDATMEVAAEAGTAGDIETKCIASLFGAHALIEAGKYSQAMECLLDITTDSACMWSIKNEAHNGAVLRAAWILLEASGAHKKAHDTDDCSTISDRLLVEISIFIQDLETRQDQKFEVLYYMTSVLAVILKLWQRAIGIPMELAGCSSSGCITAAINNTSTTAPTSGKQSSKSLQLKEFATRGLNCVKRAAFTIPFFSSAYNFYAAQIGVLSSPHSFDADVNNKMIETSIKACPEIGRWSRHELVCCLNTLKTDIKLAATPVEIH